MIPRRLVAAFIAVLTSSLLLTGCGKSISPRQGFGTPQGPVIVYEPKMPLREGAWRDSKEGKPLKGLFPCFDKLGRNRTQIALVFLEFIKTREGWNWRLLNVMDLNKQPLDMTKFGEINAAESVGRSNLYGRPESFQPWRRLTRVEPAKLYTARPRILSIYVDMRTKREARKLPKRYCVTDEILADWLRR
jgi:hypothetical protein